MTPNIALRGIVQKWKFCLCLPLLGVELNHWVCSLYHGLHGNSSSSNSCAANFKLIRNSWLMHSVLCFSAFYRAKWHEQREKWQLSQYLSISIPSRAFSTVNVDVIGNEWGTDTSYQLKNIPPSLPDNRLMSSDSAAYSFARPLHLPPQLSGFHKKYEHRQTI